MLMRYGLQCAVTVTLILLHSVSASEKHARLPQSELKIDLLHRVHCNRKTKSGDTISVHYNGTLKTNGRPFDSSYSRNEPLTFHLGVGQVIEGWDKGLLDMCIGEERKLTIPPHLAYGNQAVGIIPASSTLVFETKLMGIEGVDEEEEQAAATTASHPTPTHTPATHHHHHHPPPPQDEPDPSKTSSEDEAVQSQQPIQPGDPTPGGDPDTDDGEDEGECRLLGPFALVVQGGLGVLALLSLVWKRYRERPRRPLKIWFFDVSKQVVGSVLLHILNLLMSMLSSSDLELAHKAKELNAQMIAEDGRRINPCSFYLINIAIDTTIGIPILIIFLRLLHYAFRLTPLARPVESIKSGHYGQPPRATWWLKQALIYFIGLVLMKLCVFFLYELLPWIAWVGDWALRWTEGNEAIQITFVMFVFPLIMNGLQYYIIDHFIKEPSSSEYQQAPDTGSEDPLAGSYYSVSGHDDSDRDSLDSEERDKGGDVTTTIEVQSSQQRPLIDEDDDGDDSENRRRRTTQKTGRQSKKET